jgi:phosphonopyruvate decarboxylase
MIKPEYFYEILIENNVKFFSGVPDSLLKSFCAYLTDNVPEERNIIAANEGCATALAAGYYLSSGKIPLVYMQNSGIGNAVNPLMSLFDPDVYSIPVLLVIGWRGQPGVHDEPQHIKQGKVTCDLLDAMKIPYDIMSVNEEELKEQVSIACAYMNKNKAPYALIVKKDSFGDYKLEKNIQIDADITREQAIETILNALPEDAIIVSTTGMASRELFEIREKKGQLHNKDFLTVGSMGHASQIALAIALQKKERKVVCIDGDGAAIMHMGAMSTIGSIKPPNYVHIVLNNGSHDSVGGQPTIARAIDLCGIASADGYENVVRAKNLLELENNLNNLNLFKNLTFLEVYCKKGARRDLGRPTRTPVQNKEDFMEFLK